MGQLFSSSSTNEAMNSVLSIYSATRALQNVNGYGSEGDDLSTILIDTDTMPKNLSIDTSSHKAKNEWAGEISITVTNNGNGFDIVYPSVPKESCIKLSQQLAHSGNFDSIQVGSNNIDNQSNLNTVSSACSEDKNDLVFKVNSGE
ncbi:hypothetical protein VL10_24010 [Leclercia adecarboxylata]|nr:hypothetical protein VL10_24010 [Leclercia adecarboxylata]KMN66745.1 hypothetical protein VK95_04450 [Leclercia sp. LK8]